MGCVLDLAFISKFENLLLYRPCSCVADAERVYQLSI